MSQTTGQTSATKRPTLEMLLALASFIAGVLAKLSLEEVQNLLKNKNTILRKKLEEVFEVPADLFAEVRTEWEEFYKYHFGITISFSKVSIPTQPTSGLWRLLFIPQDLTLDATIVAMLKHFRVVGPIKNLDTGVSKNTRNSSVSYAVWVRVGKEPDDNFRGKSTRDVDMAGNIGCTLLERLLLDLDHFGEESKHLDVEGMTLCTASRRADGYVPCVYWLAGEGEVRIGFCSVDEADERYGLRQVVS